MLLDVGQDVLSSLFEWTQNLPTNTSMTVYSALEVSATEPTTAPSSWDTVTKDGSIPNLGTGSITNTWLWIKIEMATSDTGETPSIDDLDPQVTFDVSSPTVGEDLDTAAEWNDNNSTSNVTVTGDTLVLGSGGDSGYRVSDPIDLSPIFNFQSAAINYTIDEEKGQRLIPDLTSHLSGAATGVPVSSWKDYSSNYLWEAFDRTTAYFQANGFYAYHVPFWVGFVFAEPKIVNAYHFRFYAYYPTAFELLATNDGINFDVLDSYGGEDYSSDADFYRIISPFNSTAYRNYYLKIYTFSGYGGNVYVRELQFYTAAFELRSAIVESATEPTTPPADSEFTTIENGATAIPGISVGDDLRGKWLWLKQAFDCDWDKPVLTDCAVSLTGGSSLSLKLSDLADWQNYDSVSNIAAVSDLRLNPTSGIWEPSSYDTIPEIISEAVQDNSDNRMTGEELEVLDATDFDDTNGYDYTTGDLDVGIVAYNVMTDTYFEIDEIHINETVYKITEEIPIIDGTVVESKIDIGFPKGFDDSYDYSQIKVYASISGSSWQLCTNNSTIPGAAVDTVMSSDTIQFKIEIPNDLPSTYGIILNFYIR